MLFSMGWCFMSQYWLSKFCRLLTCTVLKKSTTVITRRMRMMTDADPILCVECMTHWGKTLVLVYCCRFSSLISTIICSINGFLIPTFVIIKQVLTRGCVPSGMLRPDSNSLRIYSDLCIPCDGVSCFISFFFRFLTFTTRILWVVHSPYEVGALSN